MCHFNSIKEQLKPYHQRIDVGIVIFQFHKGTIKTLEDVNTLWELLDFNSIKVQLKHLEGRYGMTMKKFQFHKGTIKTYNISPT